MSKRAVIVIGSNSTRYVSADPENARIVPVRRRVETRLFLHMEDHCLSPQAVDDTAAGVARFVREADAPLLGVYATSATRDARNADALARAIREACGLPLTVLSGPEEAAASFYGAAGDAPAGIIDIGGGSTEFAIGAGMRIDGAVSLQLGASRLFTLHPIHAARDVPAALEGAAVVIAGLPENIQAHQGVERFYSVGGTGTACARLLLAEAGKTEGIEGFVLTRDEVYRKLLEVAAVTRDKRALIPGFPPTRIDILPTGMAILIAAMDGLRLADVAVTERCNADGLLRAGGKIAP